MQISHLSEVSPGDIWKSEKDKCDEINQLIINDSHSPLIGFAKDGYPIYGPVGKIFNDVTKLYETKILRSSYTGSTIIKEIHYI